jgi:hypothetical protein
MDKRLDTVYADRLHTKNHFPYSGEIKTCISIKISSYSRISEHFMEPKGSLPCSQEPATNPYPEQDQFSPYHLILPL